MKGYLGENQRTNNAHGYDVSMNSLWHADYKLLDDASGVAVRYGVFDHATTENAFAVLDAVIKNHGKPTAILTDCSNDNGTQFYANKSRSRKRNTKI